MARSLIPDPLELLREAVNRLEAGANAAAGRHIAGSQQLAKMITQLAATSMGLERVLERALAAVFARLDLPSRSELMALSAAVQRIEDKLDQLHHASARASAAPRPARTRRPPPPVAPAPAAAPAPKPAARRTRKAGGT